MPKIRVLVVDDAVVMRRMITEALSQDPEIEVVGVAANGKIALAKIPQVNPDLITMDVEMPEMDGVTAVRELRKTYPRMPVIMFSTLTLRGAETTLEAMSAGASDYVAKPSNVGNVVEGIQRLREELIPKIRAHIREPEQPGATRLSKLRAASPSSAGPFEAIAIGSSTGGPNALAELFATLPADLGVPVFLVQHMPPLFTQMLAERLGKKSAWSFCEAQGEELVEPGHVYIAPGGKHLEVVRAGTRVRTRVHLGPEENSCRPAVDVLFQSVSNVYAGRTLALVLTGMGQDGLRGCRHLSEKAAEIIVQDESSSIVWGMPGSVAQAGLANKVVSIDRMAREIIDAFRRRGSGKVLLAS
jgi:two-component system chemotaxis response regulator CheB